METAKSPAEQKVILHNVSWGTYERLMDERGERRVPRFAYDRGELEVMSPSTEHESVAYFLELVVAILAEEADVNAYGRVPRPSSAKTWSAASSLTRASTFKMRNASAADSG